MLGQWKAKFAVDAMANLLSEAKIACSVQLRYNGLKPTKALEF